MWGRWKDVCTLCLAESLFEFLVSVEEVGVLELELLVGGDQAVVLLAQLPRLIPGLLQFSLELVYIRLLLVSEEKK